MRLNPYLMFNGQCEAAFRFYETCLRGKISMLMTYGHSPLAGETRLTGRRRSCMRHWLLANIYYKGPMSPGELSQTAGFLRDAQPRRGS